jgi:hypothetical protein
VFERPNENDKLFSSDGQYNIRCVVSSKFQAMHWSGNIDGFCGCLMGRHRCDCSGDSRRHNTIKLVGFMSKNTNWRAGVQSLLLLVLWYFSIDSHNTGPPHTSSPLNLGQYNVLLWRLCHFSSWHIEALKNAQLFWNMDCCNWNGCNLANIRPIGTNQSAKTFKIKLFTH